MKKPFPALCRDCKWSTPEPKFEWNNLCTHPKVVSKDRNALARNREGQPYYSSCVDERGKAFFAPCGIRGKLWTSKNG